MLQSFSRRVLQVGRPFSTLAQVAQAANFCRCQETSYTARNCSSQRRILFSKSDQSYSKHKVRRLHFMLPSLALLAVAVLENKNKDVKDSKTLENDNKDILDLLAKGHKMITTECSFKSVEAVYTEALHIALSRKNLKVIAYVQDQYANLALRHDELEKAEQLFKSTIRNLLDTGMKDNDIAILEISLKLSMIYAGREKDQFATSGYCWVISTSRSNLAEIKKKDLKVTAAKNEYDNQLALLGMALDSYGRYNIRKGQLQEALTLTRESADISVELFGENDIRTLVIFNDIGAIFNQLGKFDEAIKILEKVIKIATKTRVMDHSDIAVFCANLGGILYKHGKKEKAKNAFEKARKEATLSNDKSLQKKIEFSISKSKAFEMLNS